MCRAGCTIDQLHGPRQWRCDQGFVVCGGERSLQSGDGRLVSWRDLTQNRLIP
ncbi:MAG: hypothetical protein ANABAC_1902 [Anaerolineae bacterium]|nr:MAG: hypothetical protein ANABAC_1902 [Anaerolineae bacterium]